ncbi:MAG: helix-turn-helix domain-containing protein [bacterium]|nr:helix-turn-helix domain-containing protein [bacterium]
MERDAEQVFQIVGERIRKRRLAKSLSQDQLALESGIDRSHIGFIEQGRRKPTIPTLLKISRALDVSLEQLLRGI